MATATEAAVEHDAHDDHHPTNAFYVQVALTLGVLTALEISTYFVEFGRATVPLLIILMAIKFAMVGGYFMHLKYDPKVYTRFMGLGLGLALVLYTAVLATFLNVVNP